MNAEEGRMIELQPTGLDSQAPQRPPGDRPGAGRAPHPRENLFLNEHLRSFESSLSDSSSVGSNSENDASLEHQALLEDSPLPQPNIAALYRTIYDYVRYLGVLGLFVYSFVMIFSSKGNCYNGSTAIKKLPPVKCDMYEVSHTDIRVLYSTIVILILDPSQLSVLFNLLHRKHMIQLQVTLVIWIIFVINNAEDELFYSPDNFPDREKESWLVRHLLDIFYGFSIVRRKGFVINFCYFVFDLILYPNSLFFTLMVTLFFMMILAILLVTLLNFLGWTNIDLDRYAGQQLNNRNGLTPVEMKKLVPAEYMPPRRAARLADDRGQEDLDRSRGSDASEVMCSICFIPFEPATLVNYLPKCNHVFHQSCITEWFKSHGTCPICREDIKKLVRQEENNTSLLNRSIFEIEEV